MARRRTGLVKADAETTGGIEIMEGPQPTGGSDAADSPDGGYAAAGYVSGYDTQAGGHSVERPAEHPEDILAEPPDARDVSAELAAPPRRKLPWLTLVLSACVVAAAAFSGGALVEKHHLNGSTTAGRSGFPTAATGGGTAGGGGRFGQTGGGTGTTAGGGTAANGLTVGTVKLVDGKTLYVTDAQGNIVKVTTGGSTKITESKSGKVSDLKAGQSVTVLGTKGSDGNVTATTVTEGGSTAGGFGGFPGGGFGGGSGGGFGGGTGGAGGGTGN
ncbi:hypothetical protein SAMN05216223_10553 [Actinacidiphila yanglinensis]|uniref:DUF5666 domain-containing protein n=1 Tax=Actinacidiphila yanglinensis TaxID=310779 RepID=A0A1H5ZYM2_9ACTN|nr:hypothetical protein [Actinacidiphila yanglinensis]SEG41559.1 hypothetical protein SAMN05216223_10553 [Actinacidiphila yanglinensis]